MEFELWWLLIIPAFFPAGLVAARIDIKHLVSESRALPRSYFRRPQLPTGGAAG